MSTDFDWDVADNTAQDAVPLSFPAVFWQHGSSELEELGDKHWKYRGGLFFITDDDLDIPEWQSANFKGDRDQVRGYASTAARVTLIRYRRRWFKEDNGHKIYHPWNQYEQGFRAHMQVIGFIRGVESPVCFSFKGMVVNYIQSILKEHYAKVMSVANKSAPDGRKLPPYAIWTTIKSGKFEKAGTGNRTSEVTYPEIVLPKTIDLDYCHKRYIGKDHLIISQDLYREAETWAHEWDRTADDMPQSQAATASAKAAAYEMQGAGRVHAGEVGDDGPDFGDGKPKDDDEIPF